ncbi:MAG: DUF4143 domain-containing protein [Bacteroidales bacterium]|nr:DUF4143 domain-containing protein [Bacteroidales bacterium]
MEYIPRLVDTYISKKLRTKGALLIEGPKWCGKTTSGKQFSNSLIFLDDPMRRDEYARLAELNITQLLQGDTPRLLDEWQLYPRLWDAVRYEVDQRAKFGQFILTGSAVPPDFSQILHSGTGRIARLAMHTMTLTESGDSTGQVRLSSLFEGAEKVEGQNKCDLNKITQLICRGGWPLALALEENDAYDPALDYVDAVVNSDISRVDGVERNPLLTASLLRSYARNQGSQATIGAIAADTKGAGQEASEKTITSYLNALRMIFVIEDMAAWNPNLRSKTAIRTSPTRYFTDPSIAAGALRIGPQDLMRDLESLGLLFETLCARDLRVYAQCLDGDVYHYRDSNGLECDMVIHLRNGKYGLAEVKLGGPTLIEEGAANLLKLRERIDTSKMGMPSFLMILTAVGDYAYTRSDGIHIVPIATLTA